MKTFAILLLIFCIFLSFFGCADDDDDDDTGRSVDDDDDDDNDVTGTATSIQIVSGNLQSGFIGESVLNELVVLALNANGNPAANVEISFSILSGLDEGKATARLDPMQSITDETGQARCRVTFGDLPGLLRVQAMPTNSSAWPVIFHLSSYPQPTDSKKPICFLSINDYHSHVDPWGHPDNLQGGLARIVWMFEEIRKNNDAVGVATVIMDAGDDFENTAYHDIPGFLPWLIETWDRAGMDVWQVGNHDYHFGLPFLGEAVLPARENFTNGAKGHPMNITFGNVDPTTLREDLTDQIPLFETDFSDTEGKKVYEQTAMVKAGGIHVGVIGVTTDAAIYTQLAGNPFFLRLIGAANPQVENLTFFDPDPRESDYIARAIDSLVAEGADVLVVLSHAGLGYVDRVNLPPGKDDLIATYGIGPESGRAVDLVISAHSHIQLNHPVLQQNPAGGITPVIQAREGGLFVARIDAMIDVDNGGMDYIDSRLIQVDDNLEEDAGVVEEARLIRDNNTVFTADWFERDLADCPVWLSHRASTPSGLGNLINDSFFWSLEQQGISVDGAVAIPSLYRADLWPGTIDAAAAYDVLPIHKLDEDALNPDSITILTFSPGIIDASTMFLPGTWKSDTTTLEYLLEFAHALPELEAMIPPMGEELKIEVFQMAGVSYEVDLTAPMFQHVVPGSLTINGEPVDPNKTYKVAMVETLAATLSYAMDRLLIGFSDGKGRVPFLVPDAETGKPYTDTMIPTWQAFEGYLSQLPDSTIPIDRLAVLGDVVRSVQPDLVVNPSEVQVPLAERGERSEITVRVRNIGAQNVKSANLHLYVDTTPWDLTDQDDFSGILELEGLPEGYLGSMYEIGNRVISVDGLPDFIDETFTWDVPKSFPPGPYTLHVKIDSVVGEETDPNTGEPYTDHYSDNDSGEQVMRYMQIR